MYLHLSETAKEVLKKAQDLANVAHLQYVGTEHILLAILDHGLGLGAQVLDDFSVTQSQVQDQVDHLTRQSLEETWVFGRLPGTPHFKKVLAYAIKEAEDAKDKKVGTEYLLLGLLCEKGCVAEQALGNLGVTLEKVRRRVAMQHGRPI